MGQTERSYSITVWWQPKKLDLSLGEEGPRKAVTNSVREPESMDSSVSSPGYENNTYPVSSHGVTGNR